MNFFGVGLPEMIVIGAVALLIFGPKRLPEVGRSVAKTIKSLQDASKEFEAEIKRETSALETAATRSSPPSTSTSIPIEAAAVDTAETQKADDERANIAERVDVDEASPDQAAGVAESIQSEATV
ncbi:MAG: TatA/E family twin arginine-targeting protein translocase [Cyanobacteria bacterium P01_D01_bin.123]